VKGRAKRVMAALLTVAHVVTLSACSRDGWPAPVPPSVPPPAVGLPAPAAIDSWIYQLQGYRDGRLDEIASASSQLAVIDLARDSGTGYFTPDDIAALHRSGKRVLAYFEIGSIENFRPEYQVLPRDLIANRWPDWPEEYFVRYWDPRWWDLVVRPRVDQALRAGYDGVYLDTPLAYEEIDRAYAQGRDRDALGRAMVDLIGSISRYAKRARPDFLIVPQNSPELRHHDGYLAAVDGIGIEELFYQATDRPCVEDYCAENLAEVRALRAAGKFVLAVDYAQRLGAVQTTCSRYRSERFAGTVTVRELDRITTPC